MRLALTILVVAACGDPLNLPVDAATRPDAPANLDASPDAPPVGALAIEPPSITVPAGRDQIFVANVGAVTWSVLEPGGGTIDGATGMYVAPNVPGSYHVVASDGVHAGQATVEVAQMDLTILTGGIGGFGNVDAVGDEARFVDPAAVAYDGAGTLYVGDGAGARIRAIDLATRAVTTLAGGGTGDAVDGIGTAARFAHPMSLVLDRTAHVLYVGDSDQTIRAIDLATRAVTTLAGAHLVSGNVDGPGATARFQDVRGLCLAGSTLYISELVAQTIRTLDLGSPTHDVHRLAGQDHVAGFGDSSDPLAATFHSPLGLACSATTVYVADYGNAAIRTIDRASGAVGTLVGSPTAPYGDGDLATAGVPSPWFVTLDPAGTRLFVSESTLGVIRAIDLGAHTIETLVGDPAVHGAVDGVGAGAQLWQAAGLVTDGETLWFSDRPMYEVRAVELASATVTTIAGSTGRTGKVGAANGSLAHATFASPMALASDGLGTVFVATGDDTIRAISLVTGTVSLYAGESGVFGRQDGGPGVARLANDLDLYVDPTGTLWHSADQAIREIGPTGIVTTRFGTLGQRGTVDGVGRAALLDVPAGMAYVGGTLFVADLGDDTIRAIDLATGTVTTFAGSPGAAAVVDGVGSDARFQGPFALATDGVGTVWVGDLGTQGAVVRAIDVATARVTTIAGAIDGLANVDGIGTAARFTMTYALAYDGHGSLYVADSGHDQFSQGVALIRRMWIPSGAVSTYAGRAGTYGAFLGPLQTASLAYPGGLALTPSGDLLCTGENAIFAIVKE